MSWRRRLPAKAVVRRNTNEVQGKGNFELFEELFADNFIDHTPQPGRTPDKAGARELYHVLCMGGWPTCCPCSSNSAPCP
jgi:hypothetical protein